MTTVVVSQPMLFPWVGMFEQVALADVFVHYDDVAYSKGSFTNRVQVKTAAGTTWLTVPLRKAPLGQAIAELVADDDRDWRADHLRLLASAYRDAPHAEEMLDLVRASYSHPGPLAGLLEDSFERVAGCLGVTGTRFVRSSELGVGGRSWSRVLDVVRAVGGDAYVTGHGAANYLDHEAFERAGVEVRYMDYAKTSYPQLHGEFTPFVSALDLIANTGSRAGEFVRPRTVDWRSFLAAR